MTFEEHTVAGMKLIERAMSRQPGGSMLTRTIAITAEDARAR